MNLLISAGAGLKDPDIYGFMPLYVAFQYGHLEIVRALLTANADADVVDATNIIGTSALHYISELGLVEIALVLINHQASVNMRDGDGWTPLHIASHIQPGDVDGLENLLLHLSEDRRPIAEAGARARAAFEQNFSQPIGVARILKILGINSHLSEHALEQIESATGN